MNCSQEFIGKKGSSSFRFASDQNLVKFPQLIHIICQHAACRCMQHKKCSKHAKGLQSPIAPNIATSVSPRIAWTMTAIRNLSPIFHSVYKYHRDSIKYLLVTAVLSRKNTKRPERTRTTQRYAAPASMRSDIRRQQLKRHLRGHRHLSNHKINRCFPMVVKNPHITHGYTWIHMGCLGKLGKPSFVSGCSSSFILSFFT